jgi:hypothetical protein
LKDGGSVQLLQVVYAAPGEGLRLRGALGPLQTEGGDGTLSWKLKPVEGGTSLTQSYVVGGYIRSGMKRQFVEWLGAEGGVLYPIGRDDAVSGRGQSGDDAGGQGVGIATRGFIDRVRDDPLDGCAIALRHSALLVVPMR